MPEPVSVLIPLINPNEPEAMLAALHVTEGQLVAAEAPLCTLETTKSTADLVAEIEGYVAGLHFEQGQTVRAGQVFCYLASSPNWSPPVTEPAETEYSSEAGKPSDLRITDPALALARQHQLDLASLPRDRLITGQVIREILQASGEAGLAGGPDMRLPDFDFDPTAILVYGAGGHAKAIIDLLRSLGSYRIAGVLDDDPALCGGSLMGVPVLGGGEQLGRLHQQGIRLAVNAVGGIGSLQVRIKVFRRLAEAGFNCPAVIHPSAVVEPSAKLAPGVQIFPQSYVGSEAQAGFGTIINTGAIVSHDCQLGPWVNISPGAILAGGVLLGSGVLVGMGATINLLVKIGPGARIGNGATVKSDVPAGAVVRAGSIWPAD
jgi:sugar O-acyltransferase (sialic acid O-acetyltransferase NeuD family)